MSKIKELHPLDRPREKALQYGIEKLSDYELLAILIGSGSSSCSAIDIAYQMVADSKGLYNLIEKPLTTLAGYHGMGKHKAIKIMAAFEIAKRFNYFVIRDKQKIESSEDIYRLFKSRLTTIYPPQEEMHLIILDSRKHILHEVKLYKGTENEINCSALQIIKHVIMHSGHFFYIIHNHPSGVLSPSPEDIFFTTNLLDEAKKFKIKLLDHLIISTNGYYSFLKQKEFTDSIT